METEWVNWTLCTSCNFDHDKHNVHLFDFKSSAYEQLLRANVSLKCSEVTSGLFLLLKFYGRGTCTRSTTGFCVGSYYTLQVLRASVTCNPAGFSVPPSGHLVPLYFPVASEKQDWVTDSWARHISRLSFSPFNLHFDTRPLPKSSRIAVCQAGNKP